MRTFQFEILADGSIGTRYAFNVKGEVPDQPVSAGATLHRAEVTPGITPEREAEIIEAHVRPEQYQVRGGKLEKRER